MSAVTSAPSRETQSARRVAEQWLKRNPCGQGGFVIVHGNAVPGWTLELSRPQSWVPGCVAVPVNGGPCHVAIGGDRQNGAASWSPGIAAAPPAAGPAKRVSMPASPRDPLKIQRASDVAHELTPEGRTFKHRHANPHGD